MSNTPIVVYADKSSKSMVLDKAYLDTIVKKELVTLDIYENELDTSLLMKVLCGTESPYVTLHIETYQVSNFTLEICIPFEFFDDVLIS